MRAKTTKSNAEKDAQRLAQVENFLLAQALKKKGSVDSARVTAAKAIYDKLRPTLAAVEQTNINEGDLISEDQIVQAMTAIISQRPEIVDRFIAIRDSIKQSEQQTIQ